MGFLDDVATNVKNAAGTIGEKAGSIYDVTRHTYTAAGIKSDIKEKLTDLGKAVYEKSKDSDFSVKDFAEQIEALDNLYLQLNSVNELIAEAKNLKICKKCGTEVSDTAEYCEHCGEKLL